MNATVRTHQLPCEPGTYCYGGIKYDCPGGTYGSMSKLKNKQCSGLCERGHYCPAGSVSSKELPCPAGRYGNEKGLTSSKVLRYHCIYPTRAFGGGTTHTYTRERERERKERKGVIHIHTPNTHTSLSPSSICIF
jgi:hypothetical protein